MRKEAPRSWVEAALQEQETGKYSDSKQNSFFKICNITLPPRLCQQLTNKNLKRLFPFTTEPSVYTKDEYSKQHKPLDCVSSEAPIVLHFLALNVMEASE